MQFKSIHRSFIEKPLLSEIEKALVATSCLSSGIDNYPLKDYMLQSLFINLTGSQEQKLRCICWDIASVDFYFRYHWLKGEYALREYSDLEAKSKIYLKLVKSIEEFSREPMDLSDTLDKQAISSDSKQEIVVLFDNSVYRFWKESEYLAFKKDGKSFKTCHFATNTLLSPPLDDIYNALYEERNRCAHNTISFQENNPLLINLSASSDLNRNYFEWLALLNLIDKVFVGLYGEFVSLIENKLY